MIGPPGSILAYPGRTFIGYRTTSGTNSQDNNTRYIELGTAGSPVSVMHNRKENADDFPDANSVQQSPVTVMVDQPRRLSVSEPTGGYAPLAAVEDEPLDAGDPALMQTGTTPEAFRTIHLQRLANPL